MASQFSSIPVWERPMSPRDTGTGGVLESMVMPSLKKGGYDVKTQVLVGTRLGGRKHWVDAVATKNDVSILVSLKWQQVGGTAEQKVPFEVICLVEAIRESAGRYEKAYLVLGGAVIFDAVVTYRASRRRERARQESLAAKVARCKAGT